MSELIHASVDIETLGLRADSVIVSAGITIFDPNQIWTFEQCLDTTSLVTFDLNDAVKHGLRIDPNTVEWWLAQDKGAQHNVFDPERTKWCLRHGLARVKEILGRPKPVEKVWTLGYMDIAVLNYAGDVAGVGEVIPYKQHVDMRAFNTRDCRPDYPEDMVPHDPMHDAAYQAMVIQQCHLESIR